jgi:uncharacterized protein YfbU (UPF0304 family)
VSKSIDINSKKIKKLEATFKTMQGDRSSIGLSLVNEAYFICKTLFELKQIIEEEGAVEKFEQGRQSFNREHPALKSYNTTLKNYQGIMKQLYEILPEENETQDEMLDFIKGKK